MLFSRSALALLLFVGLAAGSRRRRSFSAWSGPTIVTRNRLDLEGGLGRASTSRRGSRRSSEYTNLWGRKSLVPDYSFDGSFDFHAKSSKSSKSRSGPPKNGWPMDRDAQKQTISDSLNTGWINFAFGPAATTVNRRFTINSSTRVIVRLVDLFCAGDILQVRVQTGSRVKTLGSTNFVHSDNCKTTTADVDTAWKEGFWSRGEFFLEKGRHVVFIDAVSSPYDGGTGSIRFDEEEEQKDISDSDDSDSDDSDSDDSDSDDSDSDGSEDLSEDSDASGSETDSSVETKPPRRPSRGSSGKPARASFLKDVCPGFEGLAVLTSHSPSHKIESQCTKYGWTAEVLTSSQSSLRIAHLTLAKCVTAGTSVWIGGYNGHDSIHNYAVTLSPQKKIHINLWEGDMRFPVLCNTK